MPADVRPYLVPATGTVAWDSWLIFQNDEWVVLPESIEGWDPGTDLKIRRSVQVDAERFRQETLLNCSAINLTLSWTSSSTGMTETARPVTIPSAGPAVVEALLDGSRLAGIVTLRTALSLSEVSESPQAGQAWIPGSVLADDEKRLAVEGTLSMFPVHAIDFSHTRLSINSSWHLETSTDLTSPFLGTFRLLINTRDTELDTAVARGAKDKRQLALFDGLMEGVAAEMLELAVLLRNELDEQGGAWPPDSVGEVLTRILRMGRDIRPANGPDELADFRTRLAGAVRSSGQGRIFT